MNLWGKGNAYFWNWQGNLSKSMVLYPHLDKIGVKFIQIYGFVPTFGQNWGDYGVSSRCFSLTQIV